MPPKPDRAYQPDFAVPPGETIKECLINSSHTEKDFCGALNLTMGEAHNLLAGKRSISLRWANCLETLFNVPTHFWLNLQAQYDETKARIAKQAKERQKK